MDTTFDASLQGMGSLVGVTLFLTTVSVVLRFMARRMQKVPFGADGWFMIPAWLCFAGLAINAIYGMANQLVAFPMPASKVQLMSMFRSFATIYMVADLLCIFSLGFTRISALFFYRRIFVPQGRKMTVFSALTIFGIGTIALWMLGFMFLVIFVCGSNVGEFLTIKGDGPDCQAINLVKGLGISSFILDLLVLLFPIPKIWTLQTTPGRKLGIIGVFLFATAGVAASCTRMAITLELVSGGASVGREDVFLANTRLYYYLLLEAGLVLFAANLPSLWYFFSSGKVPERLVQSFRSLMSLRSGTGPSRATPKVTMDDASSHTGIETVLEYKVEYEPRKFAMDPEYHAR